MTEKFEAETKVEFGVSHRECSDGFFAWGQIKNGTRTVLLRDRTLDRNRDWVITFDEARQLGRRSVVRQVWHNFEFAIVRRTGRHHISRQTDRFRLSHGIGQRRFDRL